MTSTEPDPPVWHYQTAPDIDQTILDRLTTFPREPEIYVFALRSLAAVILRGYLRLYHRFTIIGREHLPLGRSFVMICNHSSHLDALALVSAIPFRLLHRAFPAAAQDYFFSNVPRTIFSAIFINALPFSRKLHAAQSMHLCEQILANEGNILILFPEGTRTTTGELGPFKPGLGRLLAGTDIPVLPCRLDGAFEALPKGHLLPRPRKLTLTLGAPLTLHDHPTTREGIRSAVTILHDAVTGLAPGESAG